MYILEWDCRRFEGAERAVQEDEQIMAETGK